MELKDLSMITLKINGKPLVIDIHKEFGLHGKDLERTPLILGYLTSLSYKLLKAMYKTRLEKDRYYGTQFSISKEMGIGTRPPSDETVKSEISSDPEFIGLMKRYQEAQANYELISNLLDTYKIRAEILRTLSANSRKNMDSEF